MSQTWADFAIIGSRPPKQTHWRLRDAPWWTLFLWAAGPDWAVATTERRARKPLRVADEHADRRVAHHEEPLTPADRSAIDDDLDRVLAQVGLPPRPRGLDWYLRIDRHERKSVLRRIGRRIEGSIPAGLAEDDYLPTLLDLMLRTVPDELAEADAAS